MPGYNGGRKVRETMYQELLREVAEAQSKYGERQRPPCRPEALERLRERARRELDAELPEGYVAFLREQDGLNWNGLFIYACETTEAGDAGDARIEGFVEANLTWRDDETFRDYLVFGEGNMDLYVRQLPSGDYRTIDRVPGNLIETHPSFDALLAAALKAHL
jgi:hypothetical protein